MPTLGNKLSLGLIYSGFVEARKAGFKEVVLALVHTGNYSEAGSRRATIARQHDYALHRKELG